MKKTYTIQQSFNQTRRNFSIIPLCVTVVLLIANNLNAQQSYTFTTAGASGYLGPTLTQVTNAYALTNLSGSVTISTQGIQLFTIPATGAYAIEAYGAQGFGLSGVGGRGARIKGEFNFTAGQVIKILVGQKGLLPTNVSYNAQYGGVGGTFVTDVLNVPFVVAGGGGANWTSSFSTISDAPVTANGNAGGGPGCTFGAGGSSGSGGGTASSADGGAGFSGNGGGTAAGEAFVNGGNGGFTTYGIGGFGGGGGTSSFNNRRSGGGGGYSGGGAANGVTTFFPEGGGGGSYNSGTNQVNVGGVNLDDGMVILTKLCNVNLTVATNPICFGDNVTLTTNAGSPISWSNGGSSPSIVVSPAITTVYTVTGAGAGTLACIGTAAVILTVMPLPDPSTMVSPTVLCVGNAATLAATGADSYTWSVGVAGVSNTTVNPQTTNIYTVTASSEFGCINTATAEVKVNTNSLSVSPPATICEGDDVTIYANGAITYTWSNGILFQSLPVSPVTTTTYAVMGTDIHNCDLSNSLSVNVNPRPIVVASVDKSFICKGEQTTLSATGASSYLWNNMFTGTDNGTSISVNLNVDIDYVFFVEGTDDNGCIGSDDVTVKVSSCTGINEIATNNVFATVYPNPGKGIFVVESQRKTGLIEVSDFTGRIIALQNIDSENTTVNLSNFADGIYYIKIQSGNAFQTLKAIKQ